MKNTLEIIVHHKETRMVKDGQDSHGLQTTKLKTFGLKFSRCANPDIGPLIYSIHEQKTSAKNYKAEIKILANPNHALVINSK